MSSGGAFNNPIIPGFNPDPSICRVNGDYFLVTSTFEYYPGISVYHSKDLLRWTLIGHVITRHSQINMRTTEPSGGLWAPTIRYHDGRFYVSVGCTHRFRPKEWVSYPPLILELNREHCQQFRRILSSLGDSTCPPQISGTRLPGLTQHFSTSLELTKM
jgi:GH43 family beta-xylosidase